jgi:hypothetical protein
LESKRAHDLKIIKDIRHSQTVSAMNHNEASKDDLQEDLDKTRNDLDEKCMES